MAALFAICLLPSCTVTERQVAQQGGRIDDLQEQVLRLERSVDEGGVASVAAVDPQLARRLADLGQQVEELASQLRVVEGRVETMEQQTPLAAPSADAGTLDQLEKEIRGLAVRVAELETVPRSAPLRPAPDPAPTTPRVNGQQLYDRGYALYKQGRYDDAREVLRQYAADNPDAKLTDNALFWIGETYYDQAQYEQAILEYDKVIKRFPQGDKVPSALLKQAFAFDAIGYPVDAKILLRKVLREHPDSEQAAIARKKLEILGE